MLISIQKIGLFFWQYILYNLLQCVMLKSFGVEIIRKMWKFIVIFLESKIDYLRPLFFF